MNIKDLAGKKVLLLGKSRDFVAEEFDSFMAYHKIEVLKEVDENISYIIEGRMLNPYEQNSMAALYEEAKYTFISIEELESALAKELDSDMLLMSLKLSHDTERLKSFIQNAHISDALFFQLMKMFRWKSEDFFENDDNRDVSAAFIARFYENIERNHNVQYATTGFIHLVAQAKNSLLLQEIMNLEPMAYHPKIVAAIAMNPHTDEALQEKLFQKYDRKVHEALSYNKNLKTSLVEQFLQDKELGENVASSVELDAPMFERLKIYSTALAKNETLSVAMQEELFSVGEKEILCALSTNVKLSPDILEKLLQTEDAEILQRLYANVVTPSEVLQKAYEAGEYHEELSRNEATPLDILYHLQLDRRYERNVKTNAGFGKHIQSENIGWL